MFVGLTFLMLILIFAAGLMMSAKNKPLDEALLTNAVTRDPSLYKGLV